MKAEHLKEAQQIVASLAFYENARQFELPDSGSLPSVELVKKSPDGRYRDTTQSFSLGREAVRAAVTVWRRENDLKEAQLRRRAAQIGLVL